jgi:2-methylcitrate dehydratase PrpD
MGGLGADETASAFGLAASMAAGLMGAQQGGMVKRLHAGRAGEAGVVAAELAGRGFTGTSDVFDIEFGGYCSTLEGVPGSIGRLEAEVADLGSRWRVHQIGYKPYASCAANHTSLDVVRRLRAEHGLDGSQVRAVRVTTSHHTYVHCGWDYEPRDVTNAQMSLKYAVAAMLLTGSAFVDQYTDDRIRDPDAVALAGRVVVVPDESIDEGGNDLRHTVHVEIEREDGTVVAGEAVQRRGSSHLPLTPDEIVEKFRSLAEGVPELDAEAVLECVSGLDELDDVRRLTALLHFPARVG